MMERVGKWHGTARVRAEGRRGRGTVSNASGRFEPLRRERFDDGWGGLEDAPAPLATTVTVETPRRIITRNKSPDLAFDRSVNPYRGCEHGCVYCYARPSHAYMGLSPGLDFESRLFAKPDAARLLEQELARPGYKVRPIAIGTNTDPYQPIEKRFGIMRQLLEVLDRAGHPVTVLTKSRLIVRDIDILSSLARRDLVKVAISVTTLDRRLARVMEPRASTPPRRLDALKMLADAGVPTGVMVAPIIPAINDREIEAVLTAAARAGVVEAGYVMLRLPAEIKELFDEWLAEHFPDRRQRVLNLIRQMRGGGLNDPRFGHRQRGRGAYAQMIDRRFDRACRQHGLNRLQRGLDASRFRPPEAESAQLSLF